VAWASSALTDGREFSALERIAAAFGVAGRVELRGTTSRVEPGVLGAFRPTLLWPSDLSARLSDDELDAILAHETCHVARRDNLVSLAHVLVESMFWFHPLVWWLGTRLTTERERACDEEVLKMGTNRRSYAEGIVKVCDFCLRAPAAFVAGVTGLRLADRVEGILQWQRHTAPRWTTHIPALVVSVAIGLPLALGASTTTLAQGKKVYKKEDGIKMPVLVREVKPNYTREAMSAKIQGSVWLEAVVLETGGVGDVRVTKSLDAVHGLDEEAVKCLKQWTFKPGTKDDKPVPVLIEAEMTFRLK
jgi:TonB family protein